MTVYTKILTPSWLDQFFDLQGIFQDIFKRPFITIGFTWQEIPALIVIKLRLQGAMAGQRHIFSKATVDPGRLNVSIAIKKRYRKPGLQA